jgi:hypothetical protein
MAIKKLLLLSLAALLLFSVEASAYTFTDFRWNIDDLGGSYDISIVLDTTDYTSDNGLTAAQITNALSGAINTWNSVLSSAATFTLATANSGNYDYWDSGAASPGEDSGAAVFTYNIVFGGWLPSSYFEEVSTGGGSSILGINWTFSYVAGSGDPTGPNGSLDADGDGFDDIAFCEIYFNDGFDWNIGGNYDIETVFLHELGHSLGLDHTDIVGSIMYPTYSGVLTTLSADDIAGISALYPVPEPATLALLGSLATGLISASSIIKRKRL